MDEGHTLDLVYFDFAKAFDSVNHRFLLAKLKFSDIDGAVHNWIKSYLSNRSYQAQIDGVPAEEAPCLSGVLVAIEHVIRSCNLMKVVFDGLNLVS